jgi:hypothetical protein
MTGSESSLEKSSTTGLSIIGDEDNSTGWGSRTSICFGVSAKNRSTSLLERLN